MPKVELEIYDVLEYMHLLEMAMRDNKMTYVSFRSQVAELAETNPGRARIISELMPHLKETNQQYRDKWFKLHELIEAFEVYSESKHHEIIELAILI